MIQSIQTLCIERLYYLYLLFMLGYITLVNVTRKQITSGILSGEPPYRHLLLHKIDQILP